MTLKNISLSNSNSEAKKLSKDLGFISALALGVGTMVAGGIFVLSGYAMSYSGTGVLIVFCLLLLMP